MQTAATAIITFAIGLIGGFFLSGGKISFNFPVVLRSYFFIRATEIIQGFLKAIAETIFVGAMSLIALAHMIAVIIGGVIVVCVVIEKIIF